MLFTEMSSQRRRDVVAWARGQAWGREASMSAAGVLYGLGDTPSVADDGLSRRAAASFASLEALLSWAGVAEWPPRLPCPATE